MASGRGHTFSGVIAGITVFRPEAGLFFALLDYLAVEGLRTVIYIDGPVGIAIDEALLARLRTIPAVELIEAPQNKGIGEGLNALVARTKALGAKRILLLDQDSTPAPGLLSALDTGMDSLNAAGENVAAVGPRLVSPQDASVEFQAPRYRSMPGVTPMDGFSPVRYLITSGTLLDLTAFDAVGSFRADYVMDAIDVEWCFRAWFKGFSVWVVEGADMMHRIGHGTVRLGPIRFPAQNLQRMRTYIRNQSHGLRLAHVPFTWKLRTIIYLPLQIIAYSGHHKQPLKAFMQLVRASWNGFTGKLGSLKSP